MYLIFANAVQKEPHSVAIILSNKKQLTYIQVSDQVEKWARYLISKGVLQGDRVALLTHNEDLHPFVHLALDKINATVVPLDTDIPSSQLQIDLHRLNLKKILIDETLCKEYQIIESHKLLLNNSGISPPELSVDYPITIVRDPTIPNYIIASSGVTENKKWIPIGSQGLDYWAHIEKSVLKLTNKDKILCTRSPAYDARISEYVRSFAAASTLVMMTQTGRRDLNAIVEQCEKERISCLILIASQLTMPNQEELIQRFAQSGMVHLMVTGDACTLGLKKLCEKYHINLWNCYGPSEATFGMSIHCVNNEELTDENGLAVVPIGLPHSDEVRFHLIDGCLYIESPFLSSGYIDSPEQTKKNFPTLLINNRWIRVFNTENKFMLKDNRLVFKGRIDLEAHCKVSGVKVEPYAIQQCLEKYNTELDQAVMQVYVVIKPWLNQHKPFAYLVIQHELSKQHFMAFLKKWLRKEEMPIIICLPEFPRLIPSEKIDRRALIERNDHPDEFFFNEGLHNREKFSAGSLGIDPCIHNEMNEFVAKTQQSQLKLTDEAEQILDQFDPLARIWCEILGLKQSNEEQEFLLLGGDSFLLNQFAQKIKQEINPDYTYQELISLPSLTLGQIRKSLKMKQVLNQEIALSKPLFQPNPDKRNFFFLPPLLGEGYFTYKEIARMFHSHYQFNIYGLSDPSIYDSSLLPKSIEEAAHRYVGAIKSVQAKGPYHLFGFSFGCTLSYYVAKELQAQGESIKALHLVDGFPAAMYQKLPAKQHADLLEELINFVIKTLNNRYYDEKLKTIRLVKYDLLVPVKQVNTSFDLLSLKVKKTESKNLLALARQHLLLMLESKESVKLPLWANLYLSSPNQHYLDIINHIPNIVKKSANYIYYFWNNYFQEINLAGKRVDKKHLELLKPVQSYGNSTHIFWERAHDPLYSLSFDYFGPKPYYCITKLNETHSICQLYSLGWEQLRAYKKRLLEWPHITKLHSFPLYERTVQKDNGHDKIYAAKYCLSFVLQKEKINGLQEYFSKNEIASYQPKSSNTIFDLKDKKYYTHFYINLDLYWNGQYFMSLHFSCHADHQQILKEIFTEMNMSVDSLSDQNNHFYNYSHPIFDLSNPNLFHGIDLISSWLNQFINLLLPHVMANCSQKLQNQPSTSVIT